MGIHREYADKYKTTISGAIADRDWPMNKTECIDAFVEEEGRKPTNQEIAEMRPDRDETTNRIRYEWDRAHAY